MGYWSSATLTPMTRDRKLGDRLVLTPAEVQALEGREAFEIEEDVPLGRRRELHQLTSMLLDVVRDRRLNHRPEVVAGVLEEECGGLLRDFFAAHRERGIR